MTFEDYPTESINPQEAAREHHEQTLAEFRLVNLNIVRHYRGEYHQQSVQTLNRMNDELSKNLLHDAEVLAKFSKPIN